MAAARGVCAGMRRSACARARVQADPGDDLTDVAEHDGPQHHNHDGARDRHGWPQPRHRRARPRPRRRVRLPAPVPGVEAPSDAQRPHERRLEPNRDQPDQIRTVGYQQHRPPRHRCRADPVHDPGQPVVGGLDGVHRRMQRPAQDILKVATDLRPSRQVRPILALAYHRESISRTPRRAAMAPST